MAQETTGSVLLGVDVHSIQKYLFATTKLREVIGASRIVDDFTGASESDVPVRILTRELHLKPCTEDQPTGNDWYLPVRLGGGCVRLVLPNAELAEKFVRAISIWATENAAGLEYDAAWVPFDLATGNYETASAQLVDKINAERLQTQRGNAFNGFPFTAPCVLTGDPAARYDSTKENERLCDASLDKRAYQAKTEQRDIWAEILADSSILDLENIRRSQPFMFDTDKLSGDRDTGAYMAVVALDLNSLGEKGRATTSGFHGYAALHRTRNFCEAVTDSTRKAFRAALDGMQKDDLFSFNIVRDCAEKNGHLPIRPLVFGGDDLTFLMDARLAVGFTQNIMASFSNEGYMGSAGIAFVKTNSPLSRAIDLAESLVSSGKKRTREHSCIDFMLCSGEIPAGVDDGRADRKREAETLTGAPYTLAEFKSLADDAVKLKSLSRSHVRGAVDRYRESISNGHAALEDLRENLLRGLGGDGKLLRAESEKISTFLEEKFIQAEAPADPPSHRCTRYLDCVDLFRFILNPKESR